MGNAGNPYHDDKGRFSSGPGGGGGQKTPPHGGGTHQKTGDHTTDETLTFRGGGLDYTVGKLPPNFSASKGSHVVYLGKGPGAPFSSIHQTRAEAISAAKKQAASQEEFVKKGGLRNIRMPARD